MKRYRKVILGTGSNFAGLYIYRFIPGGVR